MEQSCALSDKSSLKSKQETFVSTSTILSGNTSKCPSNLLYNIPSTVQSTHHHHDHHHRHRHHDQLDQFQKLKTQALQCLPDCGYSSTCKPIWFDLIKFDIGRQVAKRHFFSVFTCHLLGLIALVHYLPIMRTLLATGRSRNLRSLFWRYLSTAQKIRTWYEGDLWDPNDAAHQSIQQVRIMHQQSSRQRNSRSSTMAGNILLFSQYDMYMTQFAFVGLIVLKPHAFGMKLSDLEMEGLLHFWRVVGYLLGIEDRFNLCLADNWKEVRTRCQVILEQEMIPSMHQALSVQEGQTMLSSLNETDPISGCPFAIECQHQEIHKLALIADSRNAVAMSHGIRCAVNGIVRYLYPATQQKYLYRVFELDPSCDSSTVLTGQELFMFRFMQFSLAHLIRVPLMRPLFNWLLQWALDRSQRLSEKRLQRVETRYGDSPLLEQLESASELISSKSL